MSAAVVFADLREMAPVWVVGVAAGHAVALQGDVPQEILDFEIRKGLRPPVTAADGDEWLKALAGAFHGYIWGTYVEDWQPPVPPQDARWKNPEDEAKHPKYPAGAEGSKGGQWAPKGPTATVDEAQSLEHTLLNGAITNVVSLKDSGMTGGIHMWECSIADVGGVRTFIKAATQDVPAEYGALRVNEWLGGLVDIPFGVIREMPEGLGAAPGQAMFSVFRDHRESRHVGEMNADDLYRQAIFDYIIGNPDRNDFNLMLEPVGDRIISVDHGLAFSFYEMPTTNRSGMRLLQKAASDEALRSRYVIEVQNARIGDRPRLTLTPEMRERMTGLKTRLLDDGGIDLRMHGLPWYAVNNMVRRINRALDLGWVHVGEDLGRAPLAAYDGLDEEADA